MTDDTTILVQVNKSPVIVSAEENTIILSSSGTSTVTVGIPGIQGPAGPAGPQGPQGPAGVPGSGSYFTQVLSSPVSSVTIHHNLGRLPNVSFVNNFGQVCIADVTQVDINNVALVFPSPVTGTVVCS